MTITKTNLDGLTLALFAALGLELGCSTGPAGTGDDTTGDGSTSSTSSMTSTETTSSTESTETDSESAETDESSTETAGESAETESESETETEPIPVECVNPVPIMQRDSDVPSGFYECEGGFIHRGETVECLVPDAADSGDWCSMLGGSCDSMADCQDKPYGGCNSYGDGTECGCEYGCASDADCDPGYICACAGVLGDFASCIPASCVTTDNCPDGLCGLSSHCYGCDPSFRMACAGPDPECLVASDCEHIEPHGAQCTASANQGFTCNELVPCGSVCGRPFLIEGQARTAGLVARKDWRIASSVTSVDLATRRRLAEHWTRIAVFEHASIASFARASLDLLALGAPPALILATRRALDDEIEHARLAFGLASAYAGTPIGPGMLAIGGAAAGRADVREIVEGLVLEACIGETLAALEAREAAAWAGDPSVASVLEQIADDELRHAQLGWQALRWILDRSDASLRAFALARLDAAVCEAAAATSDDGVPATMRIHGVLDDELRDQLRRRALHSAIAPCVAALGRHYSAAPRALV